MKYLLRYFLILLTFAPIEMSYAQKLPNVQENSLRAPKNVKIDGKANEWEGNFQAYNRATGIFYTVANDDYNIYFIIQTNNQDVLVKITNKGIKFNIDTASKKGQSKPMLIVSPFFEEEHKPYIQFSQVIAMPRYQRDAINRNLDSVSKVANKKLSDNEKYILTRNIVGVDSLLSIYNRVGIKTAEAFDNKMTYTFELSLPIKLLKLKLLESFNYHIILSGLTDEDFGLTKPRVDANGNIYSSGSRRMPFPKKDDLPAITSTTDFWGEYKLAVH